MKDDMENIETRDIGFQTYSPEETENTTGREVLTSALP